MGIIEFINTAFVTVEDFSAMYINMLKFVTERMASKVRIFQLRLIRSFWRMIGLSEKGNIINKAIAQRQNASVMGGISLWIPLPTIKFPDQNKTAKISNK